MQYERGRPAGRTKEFYLHPHHHHQRDGNIRLRHPQLPLRLFKVINEPRHPRPLRPGDPEPFLQDGEDVGFGLPHGVQIGAGPLEIEHPVVVVKGDDVVEEGRADIEDARPEEGHDAALDEGVLAHFVERHFFHTAVGRKKTGLG